MSHQQDLERMYALTEARELIGKLRIQVCSNQYAWLKLHSIRAYLEDQQRVLGRRMFDEPETEQPGEQHAETTW